MAYDTEHKTAAELQREIDMQRSQVESTIDQIQDRLSPGQLVDELMAYTKGGGGEFITSLQRNVTANPLPVALLGVSLAWLMAKPASANTTTGEVSPTHSAHWDDRVNQRRGFADEYDEYEDYPITIIAGDSLQRLGLTTDEQGRTHSEFVDDAGKKFKALSDESGKRAGHFVDEAGSRFKGFTTAAGDQVQHFRDEAGNLMDEATGWASHTWQKAREKMHDARDALASGTDAGRGQIGRAGDAVRGQMDSLNQTILHQFRDQPLVGGALAFALGAALGSTLPHTAEEDAVVGEASDALKEKVSQKAGDLYEDGKERAADLYATATEKADDLYHQARDGVTEAAGSHPARTSNT